MHTGEDLAEVAGGSDKHAHALAGHRHDAHRILRVRLQESSEKAVRSGTQNPNPHTARRNPIDRSDRRGRGTWVLAPQMRLTASACAWKRDGE